MEIYPVLDELASSINTLNLERVRRLKGQLLALTQRVQKVKVIFFSLFLLFNVCSYLPPPYISIYIEIIGP